MDSRVLIRVVPVDGILTIASRRGNSCSLIFLMFSARQPLTLKLDIRGCLIVLWFSCLTRERPWPCSWFPLLLEIFQWLCVVEYRLWLMFCSLSSLCTCLVSLGSRYPIIGEGERRPKYVLIFFSYLHVSWTFACKMVRILYLYVT